MYDALLSVVKEREQIWTRPLSTGSVIYIINRFVPIWLPLPSLLEHFVAVENNVSNGSLLLLVYTVNDYHGRAFSSDVCVLTLL